ncbi:BtrH N-terminal domain-containing protein [Abyssibacter profundi]|uniref:Peptidase n=1 Tax=Abyssibacter profundi TaxID=2182787 RepID=A0A363UJA3_9GAMM|nr:BtrH N-terminal domain-containing protein [Abyssibacter profundi]PWN55509.1 peptidase [Abyssibacter profundi]
MNLQPITHRHAGHCETGVSSILLEAAGLTLSEAEVLGLSSGLTFVHLPFVRINELPLTSYRMPPGRIYRGLARRIGVRWAQQRFRHPAAGMAALDAALEQGRAVGIQASVYWLPYFPDAMRFHFNAHNLIVYGRDGDDYLVSDPVFEAPQRCPREALQRARFVRGALAPKGLMYWPVSVPGTIDWSTAFARSVRKTANMMLRAPLPFVGIRGIRLLGRQLERLPRRSDDARQRLYLGQIVRMQEEIGTGGGGFRFMYAAYLHEMADRLNRADLAEVGQSLTACGDAWRQFAVACARQIRSRQAVELAGPIEALARVATLEAQAFRDVLAVSRKPRRSLAHLD